MIDEKPCSENKPIFRPLSGDDPEPEATAVESLCVNCQENGTTQILLTKIPFFKDVVLMSFECEHCGYKNNEIQSGGRIEEKGVRIVLNVTSPEDLNRQVCKSDHACIKIPEVDFEIPSLSQKGEITTVEGIIERSIQGLEQGQAARKEVDLEKAQKIDAFIEKLKVLQKCETPFTMIVEDISGNSFISNPNAPAKDPGVTTSYFVRSLSQDHALGIYKQEELLEEEGVEEKKEEPAIAEEEEGEAEEEEEEEEDDDDVESEETEEEDVEEDVGVLKPVDKQRYAYERMIQEVMHFQTNCPNCNAPCQTNMKLTNIPYFKEVIIMATNCDACGHRTNEVKSGGRIEPKGVKIELTVRNPTDFTRDILKSETCSLRIPELELEVGPAALSGRFSTVEGILLAVKEQLHDSHTMFHDSQDQEMKRQIDAFIQLFENMMKLEEPFTLTLDDPAGNSYVQALEGEDEGLKITKYTRTYEQNEDLGLNDLRTENYETDV